MQRYFSTVLILNLVFEATAAVALIAFPEAALAQGEALLWPRNYGFAALAMASASLWVWPLRDQLPSVTAVCGILLTFHVGLSASLAIAGGANTGASALHGLLAVLFLVAFVQRKKWCNTP